MNSELRACARTGVWGLALAALLGSGAGPARGQEPAPPEGAPPAKLLAVVEGYARNQRFSLPAGICFDKRRGEIYVADRGRHRVFVFDKEGMPRRSFVHMVRRRQRDGTVKSFPGEPSGIAVTSRGDLFVVDGLDEMVNVVNYRGQSLKRLRLADLVERTEGSKPTLAVSAVAVAVDDQDRAYIATSGGACQVVVLDAEYQVLRRVGARGRARGQFSAITGLSVDARGRIVVTDAQSVPVQVFTPEGAVLFAFGAHDVGWQNFSLPSGAVVDGTGALWVVDATRQVVKRLDEGGRFLGYIGGFGNAPGDTYYPVAIAGDGDRLLFVLEKNGARFQVFQVVS